MSKLKLAVAAFFTVAAVLLALPLGLTASSHREAPLISADPQADATDLYAFVSPDKPDTVTLIAAYVPFEEPAGGPNFHSFGDDVLYEIKVDNNGDSMEDIAYQFRFKTTVQNPGTFLYNTGPVKSVTDPNLNVRQTYTLTRVAGGTSTVLGTNLPVAPANVGPKSNPNYEASIGAIQTLPGGISVFTGPTDDPFFVELGGIFDLLTIRKLPGNAGGGVDGLAGYNVHSIALQVPISQLTRTGTRPASASDAAAVIGVWTTAARPTTRVLSSAGAAPTSSGPLVQVSRLGAPLVNEVVIPVGKKDVWNAAQPKDDAQFANYVTDPELGTLLKALYKINVPPQGPFGSASQRDDLIAIFLTGIPGLTQPPGVRPAEELRLNLAIPPTASPNRMGVLGGDNQGYPNGRRLADDVTDISLRAVAGAAYPLFHPDFKADATGVQLGDGVDANDKPFRNSFPYLALPHDGFSSVPHSRVAAPVTGPQTLPVWWFVGGGLAALTAGVLVLWLARRPRTA
ncbi:MAG: DUF4331 domain-containing protein [Chloroflexi bacterium]|nr:DUF4331 domain-containing protein [Chloroflexota bacterium]